MLSPQLSVKRLIPRITKSRLMITYKQQIAVLMVFCLFLLTGMFDSISATSPEDGQVSNLVSAYKVTLNKVDLGYVMDQNLVLDIIEQIKQESIKNYIMDVSIDTDLVFNQASIDPTQLSLRDDLVQGIHENISVKVNAFTLMVDGEVIGVLRSKGEVDDLLNQVKAPYAGEEDNKPESISFLEDVQVITTAVDFSEVKDASAVALEIAKGRETVQEYTIVEGDTLWSISNTYSMDIETLTELNSDILDLDKLKLGQKLRLSYPQIVLNVATVEVVKYEEAIDFETETRKDDSMYKNQTKVIQDGKSGLKKMEARVNKVNGLEKNREILSEVVIEEPITKIVAQGTKVVAAMASRGGGALLWPTKGHISSNFGSRWGKSHDGLDIANSTGTAVYAAESGKVISSGNSSGYGNLIKVDHGGGLVTYYAHLKTRLASSGQKVERGQLIGYMGSTGRSTGPHLHFEVRVSNKPMNPTRYLP